MKTPQPLTLEERAEALVALADTPAHKTGNTPRESWENLKRQFEALVAAGAPASELAAAWSYDLEPCIAMAHAKDWATQDRTGMLVLSGAVGRGKTVAAARYALATNAAWCHAPLLALGSWANAERRLLALVDAKHLVVDEIGGPGTTTGGAVARIATILSARHASGRPTVVTTNLTRDQFAQVYDGLRKDGSGQNPPLVGLSRLLDRVRGRGAWVVCARVRDDGKGRAVEVKASFRESGGCDPTKNRYEDAKRHIALLRAVEGGDLRANVIDDLADALACTEDEIVAMANKVRTQEAELDDMFARLTEDADFAKYAESKKKAEHCDTTTAQEDASA